MPAGAKAGKENEMNEIKLYIWETAEGRTCILPEREESSWLIRCIGTVTVPMDLPLNYGDAIVAINRACEIAERLIGTGERSMR